MCCLNRQTSGPVCCAFVFHLMTSVDMLLALKEALVLCRCKSTFLVQTFQEILLKLHHMGTMRHRLWIKVEVKICLASKSPMIKSIRATHPRMTVFQILSTPNQLVLD